MEKAPAMLATTSCRATATPAPTTPMAKLRRPSRSSKRMARKRRIEKYPEKTISLRTLYRASARPKRWGRVFSSTLKRGVDGEDSDGCSRAFREERQRNSLSVEIIHPATIASSSRLRHEVRLPDLQCLRTIAISDPPAHMPSPVGGLQWDGGS